MKMKKFTGMLSLLLLSLTILCVTAVPASALFIDFRGQDGSGTIELDTDSGTLNGSGIGMDFLTTDASGSIIKYNVIGNLTFAAANGTYDASTETWTFTGSSFIINGKVRYDGNIVVVQQDLLWSTAPFTMTLQGDDINFLTGIGIDKKADELLTYLGISTDTTWKFNGHLNTVEDIVVAPNNGTKTTTQGTVSIDIYNKSLPEPTSMILLGFGLCALGLSRRRHRLKIHRD